jgi:hypothetical protein
MTCRCSNCVFHAPATSVTGLSCGLTQKGWGGWDSNQGAHVVWLSPDLLTCHLRAGDTAVALVGAACSDVEAPPFFATAVPHNGPARANSTPPSLRSPWQSTRVSRSSSPAPRSRSHRRSGASTSAPTTRPGCAGPATFTSDGWAAALRPTAPGTHTVHVTATFAALDTPIDETFTLLLAPEHSH